MDEEKKLIQACLKQERSSQETLYRQFADDMYQVALLYAQNEDEACDILQDGFIKVFRSLHLFHFDSSLKTWIRRIIVNTALDYYRKREQEQRQAYTQQLNQNDEEGILSQINAEDLLALLTQLPDKGATVLKLYAIEGYSHKEIANMMDISEGTSKSQLSRARALLKHLIANQHGQQG